MSSLVFDKICSISILFHGNITENLVSSNISETNKVRNLKKSVYAYHMVIVDRDWNKLYVIKIRKTD